MAGYYVRRGEKVIGPLDVAQLKDAAATGKLLPTDKLAKDPAGPWADAGKSKLFSGLPTVSQPSAPAPPSAPTPPVVPATQPPPPSKGAAALSAIQQGFLAAGSSIGKSMSVRAQRKHELKLAKIQAQAAIDSQRSAAASTANPTPAQTTVVNVVNNNTQKPSGCSSCAGCLIIVVALVVVTGLLAPNRPSTTSTSSVSTSTVQPPAPSPAEVEATNQKKLRDAAEAARRSEEEYDSDGLVLMLKSVEGKQNQFGGEITGVVVNRRNKKLSYAQITFNLYDESGAQVGSAFANINGLEPGGRWKFEANAFGKFSRYKFSELTGF